MYKHSLHAMTAWCVQLMGIKECLIFAGLHCSCFQLLLVHLVLSVSERHSQYSCCCTVLQVTLHLYCTALSSKLFCIPQCNIPMLLHCLYLICWPKQPAETWHLQKVMCDVGQCKTCVCVCVSEEALSVETLSWLILLSTRVYNEWHTSFILKVVILIEILVWFMQYYRFLSLPVHHCRIAQTVKG